MEYLSIQQARQTHGLRIVCTANAPNPWCLSARYLFDYKKLNYQIAAQELGSDNQELKPGAGQNSAPVVAYNDERLITNTDSIILLAERLAPSPALIPAAPHLRMQLFGFVQQLAGEQGFAWNRRLMALHLAAQHDPSEYMQQLCFKYGYSAALAADAEARCCEIVQLFCQQLNKQQHNGSGFLLGDQLSALDIYAAVFFSIMLKPLPDPDLPMNPRVRAGWELTPPALEKVIEQSLLQHRERIFSDFLSLPMQF